MYVLCFSCGYRHACSSLSHFPAVDILLGLLESLLEQLLGCKGGRRDPRCELASSNNGIGASARADGSLTHDKRPDKDGNGDETGEIESGVDRLDNNSSVLVVDTRDVKRSDGEVDDGDDRDDGRGHEVGKRRGR